MHEKHLIRKKKTYFTFVDPEKAFDQVPHSVLWWAMRKLGIDEWIARLVKVLYDGANSRVRVNSCFSERFEVTVGVHQGSVLKGLQSELSHVNVLFLSFQGYSDIRELTLL